MWGCVYEVSAQGLPAAAWGQGLGPGWGGRAEAPVGGVGGQGRGPGGWGGALGHPWL